MRPNAEALVPLTRTKMAVHFCRKRGPRFRRYPSRSANQPWGVSLNKNDLVNTVVTETGLQRSDATKAVDSVFAAITEALRSGEEVRLVGFGTFSVSERAASQGRNPRTGEIIDISASKQPKFRAGKGLRDALN